MNRRCEASDMNVGDLDGGRCGMTFDDETRSTICPHPRLDLPKGDYFMKPNDVEPPKYVYVASSWRNVLQPGVVQALRSSGIDCYDFKNPEGGTGFHWSSVMPSYQKVGPGSPEQLADMEEYLEALNHPISEEGFHSDYDAMRRADCGILVLPCGRSAHLEIGWMAAMEGKRTAILLDGALNGGLVTPELMYKIVDHVSPNLMDLLGWMGVKD